VDISSPNAARRSQEHEPHDYFTERTRRGQRQYVPWRGLMDGFFLVTWGVGVTCLVCFSDGTPHFLISVPWAPSKNPFHASHNVYLQCLMCISLDSKQIVTHKNWQTPRQFRIIDAMHCGIAVLGPIELGTLDSSEQQTYLHPLLFRKDACYMRGTWTMLESRFRGILDLRSMPP